MSHLKITLSKVPHHVTNRLVTNPKSSAPLTPLLMSVIGFHIGQCFTHFRLYSLILRGSSSGFSYLKKKSVKFLGICETCLIKYCKSNFIPVHAMKVYVGSVSVVPLILNFDNKYRSVVSFTPRLFYHRRQIPRYVLGGPQNWSAGNRTTISRFSRL